MRPLAFWIVLASPLLWVSAPAVAMELTAAQYREDAAQACEILARHYVFLEQKLGQTRAAFLQECRGRAAAIGEADSRAAFVRAIRDLRARFSDGHLDWWLPEELAQGAPGTGSYRALGVVLTLRSGKLQVGRVLDGLAPVGLSVGDEIMEWDHQSPQTALDRMAALAPQSTREASLEVAARNLALHSNQTPYRDRLDDVAVKVRSRTGQIVSLTLRWLPAKSGVNWQGTQAPLTFNGFLSLEEIPGDAQSVDSRLPFYWRVIENRKVAVIHPRCFAHWEVAALEETMKRVVQEKPDQVVVDLKDTAGGGFEEVLSLSQAFGVDQPIPLKRYFLAALPGERASDTRRLGGPPFGNPWKGALIVRTNSLCGSACDHFARWMQLNGRGVAVGTPTAGRAGGCDTFELKNTRTSLDVPVRDIRMGREEKSMEEKPAVPDIHCEDDLTTCLKKVWAGQAR